MRGEKVCNVEDARTLHCLTAKATVSCARCGAQAHSPQNVCEPVQLSETGSRNE